MAQVIGRIAQEAKVKTIESGKELIEFSVVENHRYKNKSGEKKDDATFYNCVIWKRTNLAPYLKKGTAVSIEGKINAQAYKDKEGKAKASLKFTVRKLDFLPSSKRNKTETAEHAEAQTTDDLPF